MTTQQQHLRPTASKGISEMETRLKTRLANKIALVAEDRGLNDAAVAKVTGYPTKVVSEVLETDHAGVSTFDLMAMMVALGIDVTIAASDSIGAPAGLHLDLGDMA